MYLTKEAQIYSSRSPYSIFHTRIDFRSLMFSYSYEYRYRYSTAAFCCRPVDRRGHLISRMTAAYRTIGDDGTHSIRRTCQ